MNFIVGSTLAIISLAKLLEVAIREMSMRAGRTLAHLLNATLVRSLYSLRRDTTD